MNKEVGRQGPHTLISTPEAVPWPVLSWPQVLSPGRASLWVTVCNLCKPLALQACLLIVNRTAELVFV